MGSAHDDTLYYAQAMSRGMNEPRKKLTISLSEPDLALVEEIRNLTGAYTVSEVIRDALRQAARIAREQQNAVK